MLMQTYVFKMTRKGDQARKETAYAWAVNERVAREQVEYQYAQQWEIGAAEIVPGDTWELGAWVTLAAPAGAINCEGCE